MLLSNLIRLFIKGRSGTWSSLASCIVKFQSVTWISKNKIHPPHCWHWIFHTLSHTFLLPQTSSHHSCQTSRMSDEYSIQNNSQDNFIHKIAHLSFLLLPKIHRQAHSMKFCSVLFSILSMPIQWEYFFIWTFSLENKSI